MKMCEQTLKNKRQRPNTILFEIIFLISITSEMKKTKHERYIRNEGGY